MNDYFKNIYKMNKYKHNYIINENYKANNLIGGNDKLDINKISKMNEGDIRNLDHDLLIDAIRSNGYPYKKYTMNDEQVHQMFRNLSDYIPEIIQKRYEIKNITFKTNLTYLGQPMLLIQRSEDYLKYNLLSEYFQEDCRIRCKRYDQTLSPYEYWINNIDSTIEYTLNKYKKLNNYTLRESLYELILECTTFRPTVMVSIIKLFSGHHILDFSSGWGDRLIGAMACDNLIDFYCGVDPNSCLHPNYNKMINFFGKNHDKYMMIKSEFQTANVPIKDYDLVFTSPPYFVLEKYSDEETQSIHDNTDVDDWLNNFLFFSLKKCWNLLIDQGHMIININDIRDSYKFVEKMSNFINVLPGSEYLGVISYGMKKNNNVVSPQPIWIWKKNNPMHKNSQAQNSEYLEDTHNIKKMKRSQVNSDVMLTRDDIDRLLNPVIKVIPEIIKINDQEITLYIVRDDYLIGGTKQRVMQRIMENNSCEEFVYAGPVYGYAQIALSYAGHLMNKKVTLFLETKKPLYPLTLRAKKYGANIIQVGKHATLRQVQDQSQNYVNKKDNTVCLIPFGFHNPSYIKMMAEQIKNRLPTFPIDLNDPMNHPKNMWLVAGSATLLNALYIVFPKTFFNVVQVGKTIWEDMTEPLRTKIYISDEKFYNKAVILPPYPSVSTYDAKLWKYVLQDAKNGDYVWNVGKDLDMVE